MPNTTLNTILILRNGTASEWASTSRILMKGEMAVEFQTDSGGNISGQPKLKIGDGESAYTALPYVGLTASEIDTIISDQIGDLKNFKTIKVGDTNIVAAQMEDTMTLTAGSNVTLTPNTTNKSVTIQATNTTYDPATQSADGLMSSTDKQNLDNAVQKLSGIDAGADVNVIETIKVNDSALTPDSNKAVNITVPTKVGDLTNDSGFITKAVNDLTNYYKKSETYTKTEVDNLVDVIPKFSIAVVNALPTESIQNTTIYLVQSGSNTSNLYTEYIYVNNAWEILGAQEVDLSGYVRKSDIATQSADGLMSKEDKQALDTIADDYVKSITVNGRIITITYGDDGTDTITTQDTTYDIATASDAGLVKSQTGTNQIAVDSTGIMSFNACQTDTFVQGINTLILNGGGAS